MALFRFFRGCSETQARKPDFETPELKDAARHLRRLDLYARIMVSWERGAYLLLPPIGAAAITIGLAFFGWLQMLPPRLHLLSIGILFLLTAASFVNALCCWPRLMPREIRLRLERDNGLAHRPTFALADRPAQGQETGRLIQAKLVSEPMTASLWRTHKSWAAALTDMLHPARWHGFKRSGGGFGLTTLVGAFVLAAALNSWGLWSSRLDSGLNPVPLLMTPFETISFNLEIDPPAFTGLPPIPLTAEKSADAASADSVHVPAGSILTGTVTGDNYQPYARLGGRHAAFAVKGKNIYTVSMTISESGALSVGDMFRRLAKWQLEVAQSAPPKIAFAAPPDATSHGALRLNYEASDSFGISSVSAKIELLEPDPGLHRIYPQDSIIIPLDLPEAHSTVAKMTSYADLTGHPWAGHKVSIVLTATDSAGRSASTDKFPLTLPVRTLSNPIARNIEATRRDFMHDPDHVRDMLAQMLASLAGFPDQYQHDGLTLMALNSAALRLEMDRSDAALYPISQLVWDIALRIEDQGFSAHEADLRSEMAKVAAAIENGAPPSVIGPMIENLRYALNRYLNALALYMQSRLAASGDNRMSMADRFLSLRDSLLMDRDQLAEKFVKLRDKAAEGDMAGAREMLSELQQQIENIQTGPVIAGIEDNPGGEEMPGGNAGAESDPFGRFAGNVPPHDAKNPEVPADMSASQARDILDSLRHRVSATPVSGDSSLRSYLMRILESF